MLIKKIELLLLVILLEVLLTECLVFKKTNQALFHPAVSGDTVNFDCTTDIKDAALRLVRKDQKIGTETLLQPDDLRLKLNNQVYTILITDERDEGEYICRGRHNSVTVQKSKYIYIGAKGLYSSRSGEVWTKPVIRKFTTHVQEGRKYVIECTTKWHFAKLTWTKDNNTKLPSSWVTQQKEDHQSGYLIVVSTLTIKDVKLEDAGTYTCISTSRFDKSKKSSASVKVKVKAQKLFWLRDLPDRYNNIVAVLGASASISCLMSHPAEKVYFYRSVSGSPPKLITADNDKYQFISNQELVIRKVSLLDYGTYICRSRNYRRDKVIVLFINSYTEGKPYVKLTPASLGPIDFHENVHVVCQTYGRSTTIKWLRNTGTGGQFEKVKDEQFQVLRAGRMPSGNWKQEVKLVIKKAEVKDGGTYMCQVSMSNGSADSKKISVNVKAPLSPEIKRFSDARVPEGNPVSLKCSAKGVPKPVIKFYKDGTEITSNDKGYTIDEKRLKISDAMFPQHDGVYTCNVSNSFGRASATAKLMVTVSPVINKSRKVIVVSQIDQLKALCNIIQSNPVPMITWEYQPWPCHDAGYKCPPLDSKWLKAGPQFIQPNDGNPTMSSTFVLPKSKVQRFHIRCFANHSYGQDVHNIEAFIDKRDASKNLKITPTVINTDEDDTVKLLCTGAAGLFIKLVWYKDSRPIDPNDQRVSITTRGAVLEERVSMLEIQKSLPSDSGRYTCMAELTISQKKPIAASSDVTVKNVFPPQIIFFKTNDVIEGETTSMECVVKGHPAVTVEWFKNGILINKKARKLAAVADCVSAAAGSYFELNSVTTNSVGDQKFELVICKPNWKRNNGTFTCKATNRLGTTSEDRHQFVYAKPVLKMDSADKYLPFDYDFSTNCTAEGNPRPSVWWEKENDVGDFNRVTEKSTNGPSWLNFTSMKENYGTYRCYASNSHGWETHFLKFHHPVVHKSLIRDDSTETAYLITSIIAGIIILIILTLFAVILFRRKRLYGGFYVLSIPPPPDYFRQLDPTKPISEQVHKLPYFPEWEFPRDKVQMKKCVGSGAFGEVYVADAIGIVDFDPRYKLSLKHKPLFSKGRFSFSYFQKGIKRASMDGNTENPKSKKGNKGKAVLVAVKKLKEDATTVEYKDLISEMKILIHIGQQENIVNLLAACTKGMERDTMVILEFCQHGNLLSFMKGRRQIFKPIWSKQHVGMEHEFTTFDLCVAAYQVAKGLDFLASRKCVHRDVAARNVLVADNYVMKVADFGLARDVYHDDVYVKQTGGLLPFKWMAIESIVDRVFTHQSDVWAYGVLLWELMTLGGSPYPGIDHQYLSDYLIDGNRMDQPQFCPNEIYQLMQDCWKVVPNERPTFDDIVTRLARVIEYHCTSPEMLTHYLDKTHIGGGSISQNEDYLKPVDGEPVGSYKFSPPPTYSQSFEDRRLDADSNPDKANAFLRQQSDRYVPERRFVETNVNSGEEEGYEKPIDTAAALFESLDNEDGLHSYINEDENPSYMNDSSRLPCIEEHRVLVTDHENENNNDEVDEKTSLLIASSARESTYNNVSPCNNNNSINNNNNKLSTKYEQMVADVANDDLTLYVNEPNICYVNDGV